MRNRRFSTNSQARLVVIYFRVTQRQRAVAPRSNTLRKCPILFLSKENRLSYRSEVSWPIARFSYFFFPFNFSISSKRCKSRLESKSTSDRPWFVAWYGVKFMEPVRARGFMRIQCLNWKIIGQRLATDRSAHSSLLSIIWFSLFQ